MDWYAWIDGGSDQLTAGRHVAAVDENDPPPRGWQEATRRGFGATLVDAKAALDCDIEEWIAIHASSPTTMLTEDLRALIGEAAASWKGANWDHPLTIREDGYEGGDGGGMDGGGMDAVFPDPTDSDPDPLSCAGEEDCETCRRAAADAAEAAEYGRACAAALAEGDGAEALRLARLAAQTERAWGDDPAWGQVVSAVERQIVAVAKRQEVDAESAG